MIVHDLDYTYLLKSEDFAKINVYMCFCGDLYIICMLLVNVFAHTAVHVI